MPSQIPGAGYADTTAANASSNMASPYSWPPQQQQQQQGGQTSSPSQAQPPAPYYSYPAAMSGSYDSHHPPYPPPATQQQQQHSPTETSQGGNESQPQQPAPLQEERQASSYEYTGYPKASNNAEAPAAQERVGPSSSPASSRNNSYEQPAQGVPVGGNPYGSLVHSRSTESAGSADKKSPSKFPSASPPPAYGHTVAHPFAHPYPYGWAPYAAVPYPPPPQALHHQHSLASEFAARSRQASADAKNETSQKKPALARARSPTQIESARREEVAHMGCTCKKSKCLKLYCMCFGASVVCGPNCRCLVCFNTPDHEAERKEAVRAIVSRNPAAFDTKFKKNSTSATDKTKETVGNGNDRVLTHKIGCKCRKSQCTKKYCECFNVGIKCSATCRCTGCQNMPPGGFGPDPRYGYPMVPPQPYTAPPPPPMVPRPRPVPYIVEEQTCNAAQTMALMKNSSPDSNLDGATVAAPTSHATTDGIANTVSSETTSETQHSSPHVNKGDEGGVANVLLMAAYAMTELNSEESPHKQATESASNMLRASPKRKSPEVASSTGDGHSGNGVVLDASPQPFPGTAIRKQEDGETPPAKTGKSPSTSPRRPKRSRLGTHKKKPAPTKNTRSSPRTKNRAKHPVDSEEEPENKSPMSVEEEEDDVVESTPMTRSRLSRKAKKDVLTPVSARCIDFRRMDVKGKGKADNEGSDDSNTESESD